MKGAWECARTSNFPITLPVEENVIFPSPKAKPLSFRSSCTPRCAGKTHVIRYEPSLKLGLYFALSISITASGGFQP